MSENDQLLTKLPNDMDKELESLLKQSLSLEKQLQPLYERNEEILEQSSTIVQSVNKIAKSMEPLLKSIEESSKIWSESLKEITELIKSLAPKYISKEQYATYFSNAQEYGKRGWGIHPDFPYNIIIQDSKIVDAIIEECENSVIDSTNACLNAVKDEIETEFKSLQFK